MWFNKDKISNAEILKYQRQLLSSHPNYVVIDDLFCIKKLDEIVKALQQDEHWETQKHTYDSLYVDDNQWNDTNKEDRFVKRDVWRFSKPSSTPSSQHADQQSPENTAQDFLSFLRSEEFMAFVSQIFNVQLTDLNVAAPSINTNYFRLDKDDFVEIHADDSPGREVCMLIYLNKDWAVDTGGELVFSGKHKPVSITPTYNRCVLFNPFSEGSEHWVKKLNSNNVNNYRYNITSWYWSE
jgi:Rps23 Pro-64 3,4-dihydroxylase Tpa1-like proline 4-hydroxylase